MRYSLTEMLILVLFIGSLTGVWIRREHYTEFSIPWSTAPEEAKSWDWTEYQGHVFDKETGRFVKAFRCLRHSPKEDWGFAGRCKATPESEEFLTIVKWTRPPGLFGHLYRIEVWLSAFFGILLIFITIRRRQIR